MFSLTDEFARAQYDYTRERLLANKRPRRDEFTDDAPRGLLPAFFHRHPRYRLRSS
jgi:hypothetical protein